MLLRFELAGLFPFAILRSATERCIHKIRARFGMYSQESNLRDFQTKLYRAGGSVTHRIHIK